MLLALLLTACAPRLPFEIPVTATLGGAPLVCGQSVGLGTDSATVVDARLFVSELTFLTAEGEAVPATLTADGAWQTEEVALLDFEDGCFNGTAGTNTRLVGEAPEGSYAGLRFTVGLPLALNHANPATAEAPLSTTSMHWTWQAGYKFIRLDYSRSESLSAEEDDIAHLGSTDCQGTVGDISGCDRPDRPYVELEVDPFDAALTLTLDDLLVTGGCMSTIHEEGCVPFFDALGMDLASGEALSPTGVFTVSP
ncbi:MAG: metallo-mystery pair system four-Cys motif protein [Alphaproteobacteria bacterium]|nr:metallo-mystery pair system four-Cys motif protein [Alphaproteobacteria bacterium]